MENLQEDVDQQSRMRQDGSGAHVDGQQELPKEMPAPGVRGRPRGHAPDQRQEFVEQAEGHHTPWTAWGREVPLAPSGQQGAKRSGGRPRSFGAGGGGDDQREAAPDDLVVPERLSLVDLDDTPIASTWTKKEGTLGGYDMSGKRELRAGQYADAYIREGAVGKVWGRVQRGGDGKTCYRIQVRQRPQDAEWR